MRIIIDIRKRTLHSPARVHCRRLCDLKDTVAERNLGLALMRDIADSFAENGELTTRFDGSDFTVRFDDTPRPRRASAQQPKPETNAMTEIDTSRSHAPERAQGLPGEFRVETWPVSRPKPYYRNPRNNDAAVLASGDAKCDWQAATPETED